MKWTIVLKLQRGEIWRVGKRRGYGRNREGECRQSCCHFSNSRAAAFRGPGHSLPPCSPSSSSSIFGRLFQAAPLSFGAESSVASRAVIYLILSPINQTERGEKVNRERERGERTRWGSNGISLTTSSREIDDAFSSRERWEWAAVFACHRCDVNW